MFLNFFKIFLNKTDDQSWALKFMAALIMGRREYARSSLPHRLSACLLLPPWSLTVVVTAIAAPWRHEERGGRQVAQPQLRTMVSLEWFPSTPAIRGRGSSSTREAHPAQHQEVRAPMDVVVKKLEREMDFMPSVSSSWHVMAAPAGVNPSAVTWGAVKTSSYLPGGRETHAARSSALQ